MKQTITADAALELFELYTHEIDGIIANGLIPMADRLEAAHVQSTITVLQHTMAQLWRDITAVQAQRSAQPTA